jgi:hypothetical protein
MGPFSAKRIKKLLSILVISTFLPIGLMPSARATASCNPTLITQRTSYSLNSYSIRQYVFTDVGTCTWSVPTSLGLYAHLDLEGGGGGGGAGSFAGATHIGGGGGGGSIGVTNFYLGADLSLTPGTSVAVTIGAGGTGGASTTSGAAGGNGGTGGTTSWTPASGTSASALGGRGGTGGSYSNGPIGGTGGNFLGSQLEGNYMSTASSGAAGYNGNGGGGGAIFTPGKAGTSTSSGAGGTGASTGNLIPGPGGGGGTSGVRTNTAGDSTGATYSRSASYFGSYGGGGGGGAGCASDSACTNIAGSVGGPGYAILSYAWGITSSDSSESFVVGQSVNKLIATVSPSPLPATWAWTGGTLPAGLSISQVQDADGIRLYLQGTPTTLQSSTVATFVNQDPSSRDSKLTLNLPITIGKGSQSGFALAGQTMYSGQVATLAATGVQGTGATSYTSNSASCVLSGTNNSIITTTSGTGSCTITATNAGDANFNSATAAATISLTVVTPSVQLASSISTGVVGVPETLTVTLSTGATGSVTFRANGSAISGCGSSGVVVVSNSTAKCVWTPPNSSSSPFTLAAAYSGDGSFSSGSSSITGYNVYDPLVLSYSDVSTVYGTPLTISGSASGGAGAQSSWSWSVLKSSDNSTVTGISISNGTVLVSGSLIVGSYPMIISAVDANGRVSAANITITINKVTPTLTIKAQTSAGVPVPGVTVGRQIQLVGNTGVNGSGNMTFYGNGTVLSGCGNIFAFNGVGSCFWTPADTNTASFDFYVSAAGDSNVNTSTSNTLSNFPVNPALIVSYPNLTMATGDYAVIVPTISGGTGNRSDWTWGIAQFFTGNTIQGINVDNFGIIHIDSTASAGSYTMSVSPTDPTGARYTNNVTIVISSSATPNFSLSSSSQLGTSGTPLSGYAVNNSGPYVTSYDISPALPTGLSFDPATGLLSGTPASSLAATTYTITASNAAGISTQTFTMTISAGSSPTTTITISLPGGVLTAVYRAAVSITAVTSQDGKVTFFAGPTRIPGCVSRTSSSGAVVCSWKPARHGGYPIKATVIPNNNTYPAATSPVLNVGITARSGKR